MMMRDTGSVSSTSPSESSTSSNDDTTPSSIILEQAAAQVDESEHETFTQDIATTDTTDAETTQHQRRWAIDRSNVAGPMLDDEWALLGAIQEGWGTYTSTAVTRAIPTHVWMTRITGAVARRTSSITLMRGRGRVDKQFKTKMTPEKHTTMHFQVKTQLRASPPVFDSSDMNICDN